jgi:hypothetical protein
VSTGPRRRHLRRHRRPPDTPSTELARDWAWELAASGLIQLTRAELELHLRSQVDQLFSTLYTDPYRPQPARHVGAYLVGLNANQPDALRRTFLLLSQRLLADTRLTHDGARDRLDRLLAELIVGWVEANHEATVTAQESLLRAADTARRNAEPPAGPWFTPGGAARPTPS